MIDNRKQLSKAAYNLGERHLKTGSEIHPSTADFFRRHRVLDRYIDGREAALAELRMALASFA